MIPGFVVRSEFVFDRPPTESCHASTLVEGDAGELLCAWFGGSKEGAKDVGIYLSRREASGWSPPAEVAEGHDGKGNSVACWNPVLFRERSNHLLLFYKVGPSVRAWRGFLKESFDDGRTWSAEHALPSGVLGPTKNKPVKLRSGRIICGSSTESEGWRVHFEYSDNAGQTWASTRPVNSPELIGAIQPSLLIEPNGAVEAIGRTRQGKLFHIASHDQGSTWGTMTLLDVPNPNSGIDATNLSSGGYLLAYNNSKEHRHPLDLAVSEDAIHWRHVAVLESDPAEFSYPAIIQTRDGLIHVTYTWKRSHIKYLVIDPANLLKPG